ncbi:hypothetical protein HA48_13775 [Pantoea wallisii]|uniref:YdgH/BhsA/McbA-like domain-containing protein n=1 Tax=Pantoea wallisii TaxID=1076551 RepID=A0A1X1D7Q1_9GAMM|nr:DUF1471 domain-containing protein [Pantoea wallisii]ORM72590.1 hypothetical protein HA48_13775 [Pantoea wallisii]
MKELINDVISIFTPQNVKPVLIRADLTHRELSSIHPLGVTSVSWATSMEELTDAIVKKARAVGAVGYHITDVESHEPGHDGQHVMAATATLYHINDKVAYG